MIFMYLKIEKNFSSIFLVILHNVWNWKYSVSFSLKSCIADILEIFFLVIYDNVHFWNLKTFGIQTDGKYLFWVLLFLTQNYLFNTKRSLQGINVKYRTVKKSICVSVISYSMTSRNLNERRNRFHSTKCVMQLTMRSLSISNKSILL